MNKTRYLLSALALIVASVAEAYDFKSGNLCYKIISSSSKTVSVEKYESTQADGNSDYIPVGTGTGAADAKGMSGTDGLTSSTSTYTVTIPQTVKNGSTTYTVKQIGERAFYKKYLMTSVTIPSTVTAIGDNAFADCTALTTVTNNATTPQTINTTVFSGVTISAAKLVVPNTTYKTATVWKDFGTITLSTVLVTGITLSASTDTLTIGGTKTLTATIAPTNATNKNVTWTSSNTAVATVSSTGVVTAVGVGAATITCTAADASKKTATCAVTVNPILVSGITLSATTAAITIGGTQTLTATVAPTNATNKNVTWTSSNTAVATVSSTGVVTAVGVGTATITCTAADASKKTATCAVTVTPILATSIAFANGAQVTFADNETCQLTVNYTPENVTTKTLAWTSNNTAVVTVDNNGLLTGVAEGYAIVTATTNDGSNKSCQIIVVITSSKKTLSGDVNCDGSVNISDVNAVITVMCGGDTYKDTADVNGDGAVNISDVNAVISIMCGR